MDDEPDEPARRRPRRGRFRARRRRSSATPRRGCRGLGTGRAAARSRRRSGGGSLRPRVDRTGSRPPRAPVGRRETSDRRRRTPRGAPAACNRARPRLVPSVSAPGLPAAATRLPSGDACTPADQIFVIPASRSTPLLVSSSRPAASIPVTRVPVLISTPIRSSFAAARCERRSSKLGRILGEASSRTMRAVAGVDPPEVRAQAVTRELGDLPGHLHARRPGTDHDERQPRGAADMSVSSSASSNAPKIRPRTSSASSIVFMPGAYAPNSSRPKYDCADPAATIRLS